MGGWQGRKGSEVSTGQPPLEHPTGHEIVEGGGRLRERLETRLPDQGMDEVQWPGACCVLEAPCERRVNQRLRCRKGRRQAGWFLP